MKYVCQIYNAIKDVEREEHFTIQLANVGFIQARSLLQWLLLSAEISSRDVGYWYLILVAKHEVSTRLYQAIDLMLNCLPVQKKLFAPVYSNWICLLHIKLPLIYMWHRIISIIRTISMLSMFAYNSICNSKSLEVNIIVCEKSSIHVSPCRVCMTYICKWKVYCSLVPEKCLGTRCWKVHGV